MTNENQKYLLVAMDNTLYALDLSQTAEVIDLPELWQIPNSSSYYCGAMNFHNNIVAVMDLAKILGLPTAPNYDKTIILAPTIASLAFMVERVVRITGNDESSIDFTSDKTFVQGNISVTEGTALLLDIQALVEFASQNLISFIK